LAWKRVTNVYSVRSTGQLLPLIIGIAGVVRIAYQLLSRTQSEVREAQMP
jgi:hypothetical protein